MKGSTKEIFIYNTLTRSKDKLSTREDGKVFMYVCGPTVYDYSHIGHARAYVFFDVLYRFLQSYGYEVRYVRNITDVDDKLINKANQEKTTVEEVASRFTHAFREDMEQLGNLPPTIEPRATQHIPEMIELISKLFEKNVAYSIERDVYYSVDAFPYYGKLSRRSLDARLAGARVGADERLRNPADFALWKGAKPGEPWWDSPWGKGRPGWHIECSAMSLKYLGSDFDIHGGGMDLIFPHHENEIAQAEAATGKPFCRMFVHNGFVNVNKEKMSKSLGNFFLIRKVLQHAEPEALRLFLLGTHYRSPIDLIVELDEKGVAKSFPQIQDAQKRVIYFYETKKRVEDILLKAENSGNEAVNNSEIIKKLERFQIELEDALCDDVNTALAVAKISDAFRFMNETLDSTGGISPEFKAGIANRFEIFINKVSSVLGLCDRKPSEFLDSVITKKLSKMGITREFIEAKIEERKEARKKKDFAKADAIRQELQSMNIEIMDGVGGTRWRIKE